MTPNEENKISHYLAVKKLFALLHGDFNCLNCLHSSRLNK